jgi:penicillin amidase
MNPPKGFLATANGDQIGDLLDNDPTNAVLPNGEPMYLSCWHDAGFRVGRITSLLENAGHPLTLDDFATIQGDARSNIGALLAPKLLDAIAHAEEERATPGKYVGLGPVVGLDRYKNAPIAEIRDALTRWGSDAQYEARAGLSLDDGTPSTDATDALASKATLLFNAWIVRAIELVYDDELKKIGMYNSGVEMRRNFTYLLTADPTTLATYDAETKDSAIFDDLSTAGVIESRDERMVTALLDAIDFLNTKLGTNRDAWRWGSLHTLRLAALIPLWGSMSIPPAGDPTFPNGFPRHGDGYNVDVASYDDRPSSLSAVSFAYGEGPVQRFVIDMDPAGPVARNVIPGGAVWDPASKHFRDEADEWRKNQNHPVPYAKSDIVQSAEDHVVFTK